MNYDFATLSFTDFEALSRDLLGRELGVRFEAFPEGVDDGMDGRHATADGDVILQAKHYLRSGASKLKSKMKSERAAIDALAAQRYLLTTSASLTPMAKAELAKVIGSSLKSPGDIIGPDDLNALLRKYPDIEQSHSKLWQQSTGVMKAVVADAVREALKPNSGIPDAIVSLLPKPHPTEPEFSDVERNVVFIIKSSPVDDDLVLWLGPKLEAQGYQVFADILTLQPGDRWRRQVNTILETRAAKVLLISRAETLNDPSVQDDIDIAIDLGKRLQDTRFIIPLRLEDGQKVKGIGDALAVDFVRGWGEGLQLLVKALQRQKVPRQDAQTRIHTNWEVFRRRSAVPLIAEPERLTSNWLRVQEAPDHINFYEPSGATDDQSVRRALATSPFPVAEQGRGFLTFATAAEVADAWSEIGRFRLVYQIPLDEFVLEGSEDLGLWNQPAANKVNVMLKKAWSNYCQERGLLQYLYSNAVGFHASAELAAVGQRFPWGRQGERHSSMLRNIAKGHIWQFGVTALPAFWPFWHFKLKSRVLFAADDQTPEGKQIDDPKKMHRLRRSVCKGWRNKQWHGRMLAFLDLLSGDSAFIRLQMSPSQHVVLDASPILFSSPVSTLLPDELGGDAEEIDETTLGRPEAEEEANE
ncbi:toll/interleukin-1 receptor domain-containing protein [Sedimentitalea sp. XS_ASV28]|uniref:toll/interleukin-1 receptor domain-containing protein n=1 Tax=Sedimentitalea sp. XS_ASV28 TaxID=3241296 RepID=UPI003517102B